MENPISKPLSQQCCSTNPPSIPKPVITRLFTAELDIVLQNIFLELDPVLLKACRSVCQQ